MSVHTPTRALTRVNGPDQEKNLLIGPVFAKGTTDDGDSVEVQASGNVVRFSVALADGRHAQYDLDIQPHVDAAVALAKEEA
jgi:hypothetical protein